MKLEELPETLRNFKDYLPTHTPSTGLLRLEWSECAGPSRQVTLGLGGGCWMILRLTS